MKYLLATLTLVGVPWLAVWYLLWLYRRPRTIQYPIVPKWSHFKGRLLDGDRWTGEDDAA